MGQGVLEDCLDSLLPLAALNDHRVAQPEPLVDEERLARRRCQGIATEQSGYGS